MPDYFWRIKNHQEEDHQEQEDQKYLHIQIYNKYLLKNSHALPKIQGKKAFSSKSFRFLQSRSNMIMLQTSKSCLK